MAVLGTGVGGEVPSGPARAASRSARWLGVRGGRPLFREHVAGTTGGGDSSCSSGARGGGGVGGGGGETGGGGGQSGMEEMLKRVAGMEEVEGLEESGVVMAALPLPFPRLAPLLPQLQLSLPPHLPLLSPPLPPPPASAPSSSRGPLLAQIQLFPGGHPASFPHADLDPDLIQVPRTTVPSSFFWPLKQT